ncbi:MAG: hypothetical protein JWM87_679 [Candidatus Eremiobacteraeota bacterium]|nr:hypothetical protein [Candidatus Eremiobacteraeota bacterium]
MTTRDRDLLDAGLIGPRKDAYRADPHPYWRFHVDRACARVYRAFYAGGIALRARWASFTPWERWLNTATLVVVVWVLGWAAVFVVPALAGIADGVPERVQAARR